ncbi:MAG: RrF2 family transcriptional regulator [Eggerthellaceae bacterium]|jgi:Rrf2 family protein
MDITRRSDYALRILRAAYKNGEQYSSMAEIAEAENVPYAFARSIQHDLAKAGLIKTARGAHGGLVLSCEPSKITMLDLLHAIQGPVYVSHCTVEPESCVFSEHCLYHQLWRGADSVLNQYFESVTLEDLFNQGENHPVIRKALDDYPASAVAYLQHEGQE